MMFTNIIVYYYRFLFVTLLVISTASCDGGNNKGPDPEESIVINGIVIFSQTNLESNAQKAFIYAFWNDKNDHIRKSIMVDSENNGEYSLVVDYAENFDANTELHLVYLDESGDHGYKTSYTLTANDIETKHIQHPSITLKPTGSITIPVSFTGQLANTENLNKFLSSDTSGIYSRHDINRSIFSSEYYYNKNFVDSINNTELVINKVPEGNWPLIDIFVNDSFNEDQPIKASVNQVSVVSEQNTTTETIEFSYDLPVLDNLNIISVSTTGEQIYTIGSCDSNLINAKPTDCLFNHLQDLTRDIYYRHYYQLQNEIIFIPHFSDDKTVIFSGTSIDAFSVFSGQEISIPILPDSEQLFEIEITDNQTGLIHYYRYNVFGDVTSLSSNFNLDYRYSGTSQIAHQFNYSGNLGPDRLQRTVFVDYSVEHLDFIFIPEDQDARVIINGSFRNSYRQYLQPESNTINLKVVAANGYDEIDYQIDIYQGLYNDSSLNYINISGTKPSPNPFSNPVKVSLLNSADFNPETTYYSITSDETTLTDITILTLVQSRGASLTVTLNGIELSHHEIQTNTYTSAIQAGNNEIRIQVTAPDGITQRTYIFDLFIGSQPVDSEGPF